MACVLWWRKPLDIRTPCVIKESHGPLDGQANLSLSNTIPLPVDQSLPP